MVGESTFKKYIWFVLAGFLGLTIFFGYQATRLSFDYDFEKFYPLNDQETEFFLDYREKFQSDNDFLLIGIERKEGIFDMNFLREVDKFTKKVEKLDDVTFVMSVTNQEEHFIYRTGSSSRPYINFEDPDLKRDSAIIFKNKEMINGLVAKDAKSLCIYLRHTDFLSKEKSDNLVAGIQELGEKFPFERVRISGRTIGQKFYIDKMMTEMPIFIGLSAVLVVLFLIIAFRSIWGVLVPQVVIFAGMVWLIGAMGLFNEPMNIIMVTMPSIMFVVSMSDVIHLVSRYLDALRTGITPFQAIKLAVREVGLATLLTSITTAIGFFTLVFVRVQPIQVFGVVMGIGVLLAFVLTFLMLPVMFYLFPGPKYVREKKKDHFWRARLSAWFIATMRRPVRVLIISIGIIVLSIVGMLRIEANNFLMDDIHPEAELKQDFDYLDEHYGGVRPFELAVTVKDTSRTVWDPEILSCLDTVEQYLESDYGVTIKNSVVSAMKILHRGSYSGMTEYYRLPEKRSKRKRIRQILRTAGKGELIKTMMDSTMRLTRISGALADLGNIAVQEKNKKLFKFLDTKTLDGTLEYQVTGTAHLIDKNMSYLSSSMVKGLSLSILIVALIMGLIYRSFTVLLISIVPNIVPLLLIAGVMGFVGVELKTSTAIIFTIAFGIAVDDTIHLLGKFKYELMKGRSKMYALKRSYMTTGKAMILTTLILCSGFCLLVLSSFMGTFYLGIMLCITLFAALIADLTLLPVLLLLFYKPRKPKVKD